MVGAVPYIEMVMMASVSFPTKEATDELMASDPRNLVSKLIFEEDTDKLQWALPRAGAKISFTVYSVGLPVSELERIFRAGKCGTDNLLGCGEVHEQVLSHWNQGVCAALSKT